MEDRVPPSPVIPHCRPSFGIRRVRFYDRDGVFPAGSPAVADGPILAPTRGFLQRPGERGGVDNPAWRVYNGEMRELKRNHYGFNVERTERGYSWNYWDFVRMGKNRWHGSGGRSWTSKTYGAKLSARTLRDALIVAEIADNNAFNRKHLPKGSKFRYSVGGNWVSPPN